MVKKQTRKDEKSNSKQTIIKQRQTRAKRKLAETFTLEEFKFLHQEFLNKNLGCDIFKSIKRKKGYDLSLAEKLFVKRRYAKHVSAGGNDFCSKYFLLKQLRRPGWIR